VRIVILGDAHGHWPELNELLARARDRLNAQAAIQVGDLGIDRATLKTFARCHGRFVLPMHAIDGNHDDHPFIARACRRGHTAEWAERLNLYFQPRPSTANFAGTVVGFLGGALHVVRPQQHGILSGAPNYIRRRQAIAAAELFDRERPALVVTHSCPSGIGIGMCGHPDLESGLHENIIQAGFDPGPVGDRGEASLRLLWDRMLHKPQHWVFGHFHISWCQGIEQTTFACVPALTPNPREVLLWDSQSGRLNPETI
jgi:hypothetical protein